MINKEFWKGKKVFITGHTGFKGSWLTLLLLELEAELCGLSLPVSEDNQFYKSLGVRKKIKEVEGDIRNEELLKKSIAEFRPEIIIHLAAQSLVETGYSQPENTFSTNIMGTSNLILSTRQCSTVRVIINVTTDKVYENNLSGSPHSESDRLGGRDPYSASKACSELITSSLRSSFFEKNYLGSKHNVALATARSGNVIGGGDWARSRLIPDVIRAHRSSAKLKIRNPDSIRPWQHVLDPVVGYLQLAEYLYQGKRDYIDSFNFGPGDFSPIKVKDIINLIKEKHPEINIDFEIFNSTFKEEKVLNLDSSLAASHLNWKAKWTPQEAISNALEWYLAEAMGKNMLEFTKQQLRAYLK